MHNASNMRIAAFGFRSLPSLPGSAGADKFVAELLPRLAQRGHNVIAYNRQYKGHKLDIKEYKGVKLKGFKTVKYKGLDTLLHSFQCTLDIIFNNTAKVVHIQNGGNSIWAVILKLFGKKVFISQDGVDWKRGKWPWYGKLYLKGCTYLSVYFADTIIFDNIIAKEFFEKKFNKKFSFIPFGSEVPTVDKDASILEAYNLQPNSYYLFVGRFIPDKGLHYLIPAFIQANTGKKLLIVGGSPNPSPYEKQIKKMADNSIVFAGYVYGDDTVRLMQNCYCYIQPSDVEGLSPVVLTVMGLGVPLIVSNIPENIYAVGDTALQFEKGNINSLKQTIQLAQSQPKIIINNAINAKARALALFNWSKVTDEHIALFYKQKPKMFKAILNTFFAAFYAL